VEFVFTPGEAQIVALAVARHYRQRQMAVRTEVAAWPGAPYRTTLVAARSGLQVLVEAQGAPTFTNPLKDFATWLASQRFYAEFYLATAAEAVAPIRLLEDLREHGVGLLVVDDRGRVSVTQKAMNPALIVMPDPTLRYGERKQDVLAAVQKFNEVDRRDGLRDMCDIVEEETEKLAVRAARRGRLRMGEIAVRTMDWSDQINALASTNAYNTSHAPLVNLGFKNDLHSFRGARNLVDHPTGGRRADRARQRQYAERMVQGPRLVAELTSLRRSIR